jgi:hypothetical protein
MRKDPDSKVTSALTIAVRAAGLTLLLFAAQAVRAQSPAGDLARLESARATLFSIPLESPIRILTVGQSVIEGRLAARTDTGIVVRQRSDSSRASITRIAVIWRPARNIGAGAIIAGLTGGALGAFLLGTLASGLCDRADCQGFRRRRDLRNGGWWRSRSNRRNRRRSINASLEAGLAVKTLY